MREMKRDVAGAFIFSSDNRVLLGKEGVLDEQGVYKRLQKIGFFNGA